jgi:hypothetical protein
VHQRFGLTLRRVRPAANDGRVLWESRGIQSTGDVQAFSVDVAGERVLRWPCTGEEVILLQAALLGMANP